MRYLIFSILLTTAIVKAEIPISNLPLFTGSQVGTQDTVPFVNYGTNTTGQLPLAQMYNIPTLQNPNFASISSPTGTFTSVSVVSGTFTSVSIANTPTGNFTSCGSLAGAKGCLPIIIDGTLQKIPYY